MPMTFKRWVSCLATSAFLVVTLACFEQPIRESVEIRFLQDGGFVAGSIITISEDESMEENPKVVARIAELREAVLRGEDEWARSVGSLEPSAESIAFELRERKLVEARREATIDDPERLPELFWFAPVGVFLDRDDDLLTLELIPTGASRASAKQDRKVREHLDSFSDSVARYIEGTSRLYRYLETTPERARPCFEQLFGVEGEPLTDRESLLVEEIDESTQDLTAILTVSRNEAFTLNELSQLVFNPFPASLAVTVEGTVEDVVGFEQQDGNRFEVPEISLFSALGSINREWIEPDLLMVWIESSLGDDEQPLDMEELAARPRRAEHVPTSWEVRGELELRLRPPDLYRLQWRLPPGEEP